MLFTCEHCSHQFEADSPTSGFIRCPECQKPTTPGGQSQAQEVTCTSCGTNYGIPADKFTADRLVVACKKCGNKFEVLKTEGPTDSSDPVDDFGDDLSIDFDDPSDLTPGGDSLDPGSIEDLDEHEDFEEDPSFTDDEPESPEEPTFGLDDLENIDEPTFSFDDDEEMPDEPDLEFDVDDLPEEDDLTEEERGMFLSGSGLSAPSSSPSGEPQTKKSKAPFWATFVFLIFLGFAGGGLFLQDHPELVAPEQLALLPVLFQPKHEIQLTIQEPLKGKWIKNHQLGQIFVLSGTLKSYYPQGTQLSQIQLSGRLLDEKGTVVAAGVNLAGHLLNRSRLAQFNRAKIEAFSALDPVSPNVVDLTKPIPFQVVFLEVKGKVQRLEAQINGFVVDDQPVQVR